MESTFNRLRPLALLALGIAAIAFAIYLSRLAIPKIVEFNYGNYHRNPEDFGHLVIVGNAIALILFLYAAARSLVRLVRPVAGKTSDYIFAILPAIVSLLTTCTAIVASMFKDSFGLASGFLIAALLSPVVLGLYFAPSIVAFRRRHINKAPILVVNTFLGWMILGWIGALAWALYRRPESSEG